MRLKSSFISIRVVSTDLFLQRSKKLIALEKLAKAVLSLKLCFLRCGE